MIFILDKFVDALFIFIGVYFAFHFDQYQKDLESKRELEFNVVEIMKSLPREEPLRFIEPFKIKEKRDGNNCEYLIDVNFETNTTGGDFLRVIKNRGLIRFVENKNLISLLTVYYNEVLPDFKERKKKFYESYKDFFSRVLVKENQCLPQEKLKVSENRIRKDYVGAKIQDGIALKLGHYLRKELEKVGYQTSGRKSYRLEYRFEIAETPEELKLIEDRKKKIKFERIGQKEEVTNEK